MITLAYAALWVFVFSLPWENTLVVSGIGVISKLTGGVALVLTLVAAVVSGRLRRWHTFHFAALFFVAWCALSLFIINLTGVPKKLYTYVQLLTVLWMIWELAPSKRRLLGLLGAYVLGASVAATQTIWSYREGIGVFGRFTAGDFDANELAMILALAVPMAWHLGMNDHRPLLRWVYRGYLPLGLVAIGLTGSRGGMLAAMTALLIVPLTMTRLTPARLTTVILILGISGGVAIAYVPDTLKKRFATTSHEVEDLRLGGRFKLWVAGMHAFVKKPILGYGTSGFKAAIRPQLGPMAQVAHNSFISVLVEQGIVGLVLYVLMFMAVLLAILNVPIVLERRFALILLATLFIAMLPLTWEDQKSVWFVWAAMLGLAQARPDAEPTPAPHWVPRYAAAPHRPVSSELAAGRNPRIDAS